MTNDGFESQLVTTFKVNMLQTATITVTKAEVKRGIKWFYKVDGYHEWWLHQSPRLLPRQGNTRMAF